MYASFFNFVIRQLKRLFVLLPGIAMAFVASYEIFPYVDRRLPAILATLLTYIVTAYVLIPALIRLVRIFIKPKHIPLYCTTPDGFASDPINIGIVGTRDKLTRVMEAAGWYHADPRTLKNLWRLALSVVLKNPYLTAPFSNLYMFGRSQDIGFQLPTARNPLHRHHVRFWARTFNVPAEYRNHVHFWQHTHRDTNHKDASYLWLGAASRDIGLALIRHNAQLTHRIHDDTDAERDMIVGQLKKTGKVAKVRQKQVSQPYRLLNRTIGGTLATDGILTIVTLK